MRTQHALVISGALLLSTGCEAYDDVTIIGLEVSASFEPINCPTGWSPTAGSDLCGADSAGLQWMDVEGNEYYSAETYSPDGRDLSAIIALGYSYPWDNPVDCDGSLHDNDEEKTISHVRVNVVQRNEAALPADTEILITWSVTLLSNDNFSENDPWASQLFFSQVYDPQAITSRPPELCVNLIESDGYYTGGSGFQLFGAGDSPDG